MQFGILSHKAHWPRGSTVIGQRPLHTPPPVSSIQTPGKRDGGVWMMHPNRVCNPVEGPSWSVLSVAPRCWMCPGGGWFTCASGARFDVCWWYLRSRKWAGLSQSIDILSVHPRNSSVNYFSFRTRNTLKGPS